MWIWLDPERRPDLQRCEARRLADGARPEGQRGFAVVEFRGRVALPDGIEGPMRLRVSADTSYRLRLGGADLAAGPAPAPGDWLALPRLACWYADEVVVARPPQGLAEFSAIVRLGEARLCETSSGRGGFLLEGEAPLADGGTFRFGTDGSWEARVLPAWRGPEDFDGTLAPGPWEPVSEVEDVWHAEVARIPVRVERLAEAADLAAPAEGEARTVADWPRVRAGYVRLRADGPCEAKARVFETDPAKPHGSFRARFGDGGGEALSPLHSVGGLSLSLRAGARPVRLRAELVETRQPEDPATAGSFRCSDPGLEKVWEVARDTLRACRQNLHLDSPRHQEMLACAGDYHVESLMEQACFGDLRLAAHDLRSTARMLEATDGRLFHTSYGLIWALWLRDVWRLSGDRALVRDCLPALDLLLRRFETYRGPSGLLENPPDWMFLDWLVVEGFSLHHPPRALGQTALNAWYAGALDAAARSSTMRPVSGSTAWTRPIPALRRGGRRTRAACAGTARTRTSSPRSSGSPRATRPARSCAARSRASWGRSSRGSPTGRSRPRRGSTSSKSSACRCYGGGSPPWRRATRASPKGGTSRSRATPSTTRTPGAARPRGSSPCGSSACASSSRGSAGSSWRRTSAASTGRTSPCRRPSASSARSSAPDASRRSSSRPGSTRRSPASARLQDQRTVQTACSAPAKRIFAALGEAFRPFTVTDGKSS